MRLVQHRYDVRARFVTLLRESARACSKGTDLVSKLHLGIGPTAERVLRRLPIKIRVDQLFKVQIGSLVVFYRLNAGDIQSLREVLVDEVYRLPFPINLKSVVDLGANIGLTSLYYGDHFRPACIIAVEPDPRNAAIARRNLAPLGAEVIEAAVASLPGTIAFREDGESNLGCVDPAGGLTVRAITMNEVLDCIPGGRANLVKIDIEGGEEALFADCTWLERVDSIIMELHPLVVDSPEIIKRIESGGFEYIPAGSVWTGSMDCFVRTSVRASV